VGNGAYRLAEHEPRRGLVLVASPHYWNRDEVGPARVEIRFEDDPERAFRLFRAGQADWVTRLVPRDRVVALRRRRAPTLHLDPTLCVALVWFRTDRPPFDDRRVRRAFHAAIDRERLVGHVLGMGQVPARGLVPPHFASLSGYRSPAVPPPPPDRAHALLAEAGYGAPGGFPHTRCLVSNHSGARLIATFLARQWHEHLGVEVSVESREWKTLVAAMRAGRFQMVNSTWCADYPDPMAFFEPLTAASPDNAPAYRSERFERLVDRACRTAAPERRLALLSRAEAEVLSDVPVSPLYFLVRASLVRPGVRGIRPNLRGLHPLAAIRVDGRGSSPSR
jgi:oligopeptide transport system substrate-binding protein